MKEGWSTSRLGDLTDLVTKGTTPTSIGHEFVEEGINFVKVESITTAGEFIEEKFAHITPACHAVLGRSQLQAGDILFSIAGALGRTGFVTDEILPANTNQALAIIRLKRDVGLSPKFVLKALETGVVLEQIEKFKGGVAQQNLSLAQVRDFQIALPPLPEQHRIVAILDEAFEGIATAKANAERNLQNARELFESRRGQIFSAAGHDWTQVLLGEVCSIARGGSPRPIKEFLTSEADGVNWVKISDATASAKYIFSTAEKIKPTGVSRSRLVHDGDFLLSNSMSFGRPYIMRTTGCIHDGWLVLSNYQGTFDQDFLYLLLGSNFVYQQFDRLAAGSTVRNLNIDLASNVRVPAPPINAQVLIAAELDELSKEIDRLYGLYQRKTATLGELMKSLLHQAFSGAM